MELKIENLTKQYANKTAINHVTCTLKPGITGLLGANGAGKSTLMRMICGVMKPTEGKITLGEYDVTDKNYRNILGTFRRILDIIRILQAWSFFCMLRH